MKLHAAFFLVHKIPYPHLTSPLPSFSVPFVPLQLKLITPSIVSERLKISGSLARKAIKELVNKGLVKGVSVHSKQGTYTRAHEKEAK